MKRALALLSLFAIQAVALPAANADPRFEVASIRPSAPGTRGILYHLPSDRLKVQGFTVLNIVSYAWDIPDAQIQGLPKWATTEKFGIEATPETSPTGPSKELESPRKKEMTRELLAERFAFQAQIEQRDVPTYSLVIAKAVRRYGTPPARNTTSIAENCRSIFRRYRCRYSRNFSPAMFDPISEEWFSTKRDLPASSISNWSGLPCGRRQIRICPRSSVPLSNSAEARAGSRTGSVPDRRTRGGIPRPTKAIGSILTGLQSRQNGPNCRECCRKQGLCRPFLRSCRVLRKMLHANA
jgi:hypothetical protein